MLSRGDFIGSLCRLLFTLAALIVLAAPAAAQSTQPPEDKLRATVAKWVPGKAGQSRRAARLPRHPDRHDPARSYLEARILKQENLIVPPHSLTTLGDPIKMNVLCYRVEIS